MPEVSIIIPFHDRVTFTKQAIVSVLEQTYQDFEILVVDDGSTECYEASIVELDYRIKYIRQDQSGPAAARNIGIKAASGRFVAFLDSDDLFLPEKLDSQLRLMRSEPAVVLSHTSYFRIDESGDLIDVVSSGEFTGKVFPQILVQCPIATPTVMVKKEVLDQLNFEEDIRIGEDVILWSRISRLGEIRGIVEPLSKVRVHPESAAYSYDKQIKGLMNILNYAIRPETKLKYLDKQKIISKYYLNVSTYYLKKTNYAQAFSFFIKSFLAWPLNMDLFLVLGKLFIPKPVRKFVGKLVKQITSSNYLRSANGN